MSDEYWTEDIDTRFTAENAPTAESTALAMRMLPIMLQRIKELLVPEVEE